VVAATGERFCAALTNETNHAGSRDRRREVVRQRAGRTNEDDCDRCHGGGVEGSRSLDSGRTAEGNHRRAGEVSLSAKPTEVGDSTLIGGWGEGELDARD